MKNYDPSDDIQTLFHRMLMKKNEELQNESHQAMKLRPLIYSSKKRLGKYMKIFSYMVLSTGVAMIFN
jgi:hypothetical protein